MQRLIYPVLFIFLVVTVAPSAWSQSITTDGNIETDAQLVSKVATGTAPLAVSSTTIVPNLNADQLDGIEAAAFAQEMDLQTVEALLVALLAQFPELGKVPLPRTGQTTCYDVAGAVTPCGTGIGLGQDGDFQLGVTWPNPRFTKNGDGTVTDELTGLTWLENADCFGGGSWADALAAANGLFDGATNDPGGGDCGLTDNSVVGEWRLPNIRELQSLLHYGVDYPAVPNTAGTAKWSEGDPFSNVQTYYYWSSTTVVGNPVLAWSVLMLNGDVNADDAQPFHVWPVRGGQ